jgi:hypothetical protein
MLREYRCRFSGRPLITLFFWKISLPLIQSILAIFRKSSGSRRFSIVEMVAVLWVIPGRHGRLESHK